ncbi:putative S1 RNA binding domain protein [Operophtera brumata]|uniref:Putative S1 RNA binding domain protein n=1 Tax=Operophtera brumata TaxID=104452 RepID=A0A0L7LKD9_OPEBR|nr:putative S1 RNA binding domain protein [Operophtera brumata]
MKHCDVLLHRVAKNYFGGSLNFSLQPEDVETMTWDWQQKFLDVTINSELVKQYPLSCTFSKLFFKKLISYLENQEVHDDLYIYLCQSLNREHNENGFSYRHHVIGKNISEVISIKEMNKMVVDGTTGMRTWEAALMLADWALCNKDTFCNKKVLELGSGVGFTGALILDWNAIDDLSSSIVPDMVIGSDIVYDPVIIQPLCDVLKMFFDRNKLLDVYIASAMKFRYKKLPLNERVYIEWDQSIEMCLLQINC